MIFTEPTSLITRAGIA